MDILTYHCIAGSTFNVEIVDTVLSGVNELHGEYIAEITSTRMALLDPDSYVEALRWPLSHIAIHSLQKPNMITLVLGR